jgi:hypothetical protein
MRAMKNFTKNPLAYAACGSVVVVLTKVLLAGTVIVHGAHSITFGPIDGSLVGAVLTPTLLSYVASRHKSMRDHNVGGNDDETAPKP